MEHNVKIYGRFINALSGSPENEGLCYFYVHRVAYISLMFEKSVTDLFSMEFFPHYLHNMTLSNPLLIIHPTAALMYTFVLTLPPGGSYTCTI